MIGNIRRANLEDADTIGQVHYRTHVETYTGHFPPGIIEGNPPERRARMWRRIIGEQLGNVWVAEVNDELVGFASTRPPLDENPPRDLELSTIYLLATHHGSGLGQSLLDAVLGNRAASLWVLDENSRAIAFYRKNGFELDGTEKIDPDYGDIREVRLVR